MSAHYLNVIIYRAFAEMRAEVSNGVLGMSIWIIEPIVYLFAFYLVFSVINFRGDADAISFMLPGLVFWKWFATSVGRGSLSILQNARIIQLVYVPKYIFLGTVLLSSFYHFIIVFLLLMIFLIVYGIEPNISWLILLPLVLLQLLLIIGVSGIFAALMPFVPDLQLVVSNGLTLVFFLSGIFFDINLAPPVYQKILYINPMAIMVDSYRRAILEGSSLSLPLLTYVFIFSISLILIAIWMFKKWDRQYPRILSL